MTRELTRPHITVSRPHARKAAFASALGTAFALAPLALHAGGIERSSQSIAPLFEKGTYAELSFGVVTPNVSGVLNAGPLGMIPSGDMADRYTQLGFAYKQQINDRISAAIILDQPYGANVSYPGTYVPGPAVGMSYPMAGSTAELESNAITLLGRYMIGERFSVHGGLRYQSLKTSTFLPLVAGYRGSSPREQAMGYVVGAAYEIPDIALRVALTYNSQIKYDTMASESSALTGGAVVTTPTTVKTPQSLNLDFQTGIAPKTLLFGGIRWVNWSNFRIAPSHYAALTGGDALVSYADDSYTFSLGVGRQFTPKFAGSIAMSYEKSNGGTVSNLGPTDGKFGLTLGGKYTVGNADISAGINYTWLGDATTTSVGGQFSDNHALGVGMKIAYHF